MKWTQYDKGQVTNLVIALKKAKFEMTGMEIVAFAEVFRWVSGLHDLIEKELSPKPLTPAAIQQPNPLDQVAKQESPKEEALPAPRTKKSRKE